MSKKAREPLGSVISSTFVGKQKRLSLIKIYCYIFYIANKSQTCIKSRSIIVSPDIAKRGDSVCEPAYDRRSVAIGNNQTVTIGIRTSISPQYSFPGCLRTWAGRRNRGLVGRIHSVVHGFPLVP